MVLGRCYSKRSLAGSEAGQVWRMVGVRDTAFVMATAQSGPRRHAAASNRVVPASRQERKRGTNCAGTSVVNLGNVGLAPPEQRDEARLLRPEQSTKRADTWVSGIVGDAPFKSADEQK
ncbi:hypothetical protein DFH09DRAFT_1095374 [Mycena vulgaris]|nr:hypothetical protein DFH09DRAFT_1095374 [Mycena vulgaris]